jgi:hypothetical protein
MLRARHGFIGQYDRFRTQFVRDLYASYVIRIVRRSDDPEKGIANHSSLPYGAYLDMVESFIYQEDIRLKILDMVRDDTTG